MKNRINSLSIYLGGIGLAVGQILYYYPQLPDKIASHFGPDGKADGWMAKNDFMVFYIIMLLVAAVTLGSVGLLMTKLPPEMINLPNRDYWLAPERSKETAKILQERMNWFGAATIALLIAMMQLTFMANLTPEPRLDSRAMLLVGAYLVYTLIWTVGLLLRFGKTSG